MIFVLFAVNVLFLKSIARHLLCNDNADLEWKLIYVGSAEDETYDQLLESVLVGPVKIGNYRFVLQAILIDLFLNQKNKIINQDC